jgi:hypothetical protein
MVFLATDLRPPRGGTDDRLLRLAADAGAAGVHLAAGCDFSIVPVLTAAAARLGLEARTIALPMPEQPLAKGRRMPRLAAAADDERDAAVALAVAGLEMGAASGARLALLDFGPVALAAREAELARAFARGELAPDETDEDGHPSLNAAIGERRARAAEILDACGFALDRLARVAERLSATLVLPVAATPWQAPSPREAGLLLDRFAGAPLGVVWDPGRLSVLAALGLAISDERLAALAASAALALENDAVGAQAGYLPGLGERDARVAALRPPAGVARVVTGAPDATDAEVAAAVTALAAT